MSTPVIQNKSWEAWYLITSDQHWDNPKSDWDLMREHYDLALEREAGIMSCGDFFCLMNGKYDKRSSKKAIRPEHQTDDYFDAITRTAVDFHKPYAKNFHVIAMGNHEIDVQSKHEFNIIDRFAGAANIVTGSKIHNGGYSGFIMFHFAIGNASRHNSIVMRYEHGTGGGAPVTAGTIEHYRKATFTDADIIAMGHTHTCYVREIAIMRLEKRTGTISNDVQTHIRVPSYKDAYADGYMSWEASKAGHPPKTKGAWWLRFFWSSPRNRVLYEVIRAG